MNLHAFSSKWNWHLKCQGILKDTAVPSDKSTNSSLFPKSYTPCLTWSKIMLTGSVTWFDHCKQSSMSVCKIPTELQFLHASPWELNPTTPRAEIQFDQCSVILSSRYFTELTHHETYNYIKKTDRIQTYLSHSVWPRIFLTTAVHHDCSSVTVTA